jgi:hypothetical protein
MIGNLFRRSAKIDKESHKLIRGEYFRRCWIGWLFLIVAIALFHILTLKPLWLMRFFDFNTWILVIFLFLFGGIYYHLYFFTRGILEIYAKRIEIEKN